LELGHGASSVPSRFERAARVWGIPAPKNIDYTGIDSPGAVRYRLRKWFDRQVARQSHMSDEALMRFADSKMSELGRYQEINALEAPDIIEHRGEAKSLQQSLGVPVRFLDRDAGNLPASWKGRFHTVFANDVLRSPLVFEAERLVDETHRVLVRGGLLVVSEAAPVGRYYPEQEHGGFREMALTTDAINALPDEVKTWLSLAGEKPFRSKVRVFVKN